MSLGENHLNIAVFIKDWLNKKSTIKNVAQIFGNSDLNQFFIWNYRLKNRFTFREALCSRSKEKLFQIIMQSNEVSVNSNCLLIVIPRLMLSQSSILHQRKKRTRLHPSNKNPFLWSLSSFISSNVESKIEIVSRGADNNIDHCLLEAKNTIILRTDPPRKHHILRGETPMQRVLEALYWTRHY